MVFLKYLSKNLARYKFEKYFTILIVVRIYFVIYKFWNTENDYIKGQNVCFICDFICLIHDIFISKNAQLGSNSLC